MPTFPRTVRPRRPGLPSMPSGLLSIGSSGKQQFRSAAARGRLWTEVYPPLSPTDPVHRAFIVDVLDYYVNGTVVDVVHPGLPLLGAGGGAPLVNGASQTGGSLVTDGWPVSTLVLKKGDIVRWGTAPVRDVKADVTSDGTGNATITVNPPILSGASPADNAPLLVGAACYFRCRLVDVQMPDAEAVAWYGSFAVTFREAP